MVVDTHRRGSEEELERIERREFVLCEKKKSMSNKGKEKEYRKINKPQNK